MRGHARFTIRASEPVAKPTPAHANEKRDWRLWEVLADELIFEPGFTRRRIGGVTFCEEK
jgi:hypothetical protein